MGSIPVGSTKTTEKNQSFFYTQRRIERLLTQPDSRTLGKLADTREYQTTVKTAFLYDEEKG